MSLPCLFIFFFWIFQETSRFCSENSVTVQDMIIVEIRPSTISFNSVP